MFFIFYYFKKLFLYNFFKLFLSLTPKNYKLFDSKKISREDTY